MGLRITLTIAAVGVAAAAVAVEPEIFSDGFEFGSICAWSNPWYPDVDHDDYGDASVAGHQVSCPAPLNEVTDHSDCDDSDPQVHPGAVEDCNGIDDDCDVAVDEGEPCGSLFMCCEGECWNPNNSAEHCGSCGHACDLAHTDDNNCVDGDCEVGSCDLGYDNCNDVHSDGCEVDLGTDVDNCGACDLVCDLAHTVEHGCVDAGCLVLQCDPAWGNCNPDHADGCETPLTTVADCGACGFVCNLPHTDSHTCGGSGCEVVSCDPLWKNCNGVNVDGCEKYVATDIFNCGNCDAVCPGAGITGTTVGCSGGICSFNCLSTRYDCDDNQLTGCELLDGSGDNHTQGTATYKGSYSCMDGSSNPNIANLVFSDAYSHTNVSNFNPSVGAAPDWFRVFADGGLCVNDIHLTLSLQGSSCGGGCYRMEVQTDEGVYSCTTSSTSCTVDRGSGSYSDNTNIYIMVEKICSPAACTEAVSYTVTGHL